MADPQRRKTYRLRRHRAPGGGVERSDGFVNLSFCGDEGDVFGIVLAVLYGLAGNARGEEIFKTLRACGTTTPYPARSVTQPIGTRHELWRAYMGRHRQNHPHQYHNGGIWPMIGGFSTMAQAMLGKHEAAKTWRSSPR